MDLVADICELPVRFKARGDTSVFKLVDESGYRDSPNGLSVAAVSGYLAQHPGLADAWLGYSADKRVSSGWYVVEKGGDTFEVGYYPQGERLSVAGRISACAEFIVREIRAIAG
jgi:hypothetical protein